MAKKKTNEEVAQKFITELFELLGIEAKFTVKEGVDEDKEPLLNISIEAKEEAGLLIGSHGATLHAIQSFLSMSIKQNTGDWVRVELDVDGWKEKQDEYLKELSTQAASRARSTGEPQNLYNLNPSQRRTIHMFLKDEEGIATESQGEGEGRYLVIKPA
jgi:spoIIIJ-associated protein